MTCRKRPFSIALDCHYTDVPIPFPYGINILKGNCILNYYARVCNATFSKRVIDYVKEKMETDPKYKRSKQVHKTKQAGVYHVGEAFHYRKEVFGASPIPPLFLELMDLAERLTGKKYDTVLFKVYQPGESLAKHQDVDGSDMSVACFTFLTDWSQQCKVAWYKGSKSRTERFAFTPRDCSMWFMSGSTNSQYSHRVLPAIDARAEGLRVSISFRRTLPA